MLDRLRARLAAAGVTGVELTQADVLRLDGLPAGWSDYDLVVTASMLEYVPRERFADALAGLRGLVRPGGRFVLFITKQNWLMRPLIGKWWDSNLYTAPELTEALDRAGFRDVTFGAFPRWYKYLATWGHVVEAAA
jgi:cyclopropane fatty-acyl-phospholipid synthase-like methyltransferase